MICPRCGAYNSNSAERCEACQAPFDRAAKREGMAVEDATGLANDLHGRWILWRPASLWIYGGVVDSILGVVLGIGFLEIGNAALGTFFLIIAVAGVLTALYALSGD